MITIYKTHSMKDGAMHIMDVIGRVDKSNLSTMHTIIVPDRASLEMERLLLKYTGGSFNAQVLTFRRLASRILPQYEYLSKQAGIMALAGIVQDNKQNLVCYTKGVDNAGFVADMYDTISMLKYCKIPPAKLIDDSLPRTVSGKAKDIATLYQGYLDYTQNRFIDSADKMDLLAEQIPFVDMVKNGYFYLCDFDNLSTQELAIVEKLMLSCRGVTVACCVGQNSDDRYLYLNDIYNGVLDLCQRNCIEPNIVENTLADKNPHTRQIGKYLYRYIEPTPIDNKGFVELFQGETRAKEVYALGCKIQNYVRNGGRYKDVYVVTSDIAKYSNAIATTFDELQIPYFCDKQFALDSQPYARYVLDYLTLCKNNGKLANVLNFAKNYLFCGNFDDNDWESALYKFENYCLKYNVSYHYDNFSLGKNEEYFAVADSFRQKFNDLYKSVVIPQMLSVNKYVQLVRNLLTAEDVATKNNIFAEKQRQLGYVVEANATTQAVEKFEQVLVQAEKIMGERVMTLEDFIKMLTSAVASVKISVIPQLSDCVVFANMAKARKHDIKFLALLGANYGAMPIVKSDCKLLSDANIKDLQEAGINVEPQIFTENKRERFSLFQLLQEPTEKLYVSFASTDGADSLTPSTFVGELSQMFYQKGNPLVICEEEEDEEIYTERQAIAKVILNTRRLADKQLVKMPAYNILNEHYRQQTEKYQQDKNGLEIAIDCGERLFFKSARTSVSQLTDFYKCPYKFFIEYGLNVKPREIAQLKSADLGNILHEVMENYVADMDITEGEDVTIQKAQKWFDNAMTNDFYRGLKHDVQMQGTLEQLKAESVKMCLVVKDQLAHSNFINLKTELEFGTENSPDTAVKVDYGGGAFNLNGKIDRVDGYGDHLIIIDYKSGAKASQYGEKDLYIGHKMQLLVYLQAAQNIYGKKPAGFYYFNMHNNFTDPDNDKVYTYNGRTLNDVDIARALDTRLQTFNESEKLGLKITDKGTIDGRRKKTLTAEQIDNQVEYALRLIKKAGQLMKNGYTAVSPYEKSCEFCDYKNICDYNDIYTYAERKVAERIGPKTIDQTVKGEGNDE